MRRISRGEFSTTPNYLFQMSSGPSSTRLARRTPNPTALEVRLLDDQGFAVWLELRKELRGKFEVSFFSHEFMTAFGAPDEFKAARQGH